MEKAASGLLVGTLPKARDGFDWASSALLLLYLGAAGIFCEMACAEAEYPFTLVGAPVLCLCLLLRKKKRLFWIAQSVILAGSIIAAAACWSSFQNGLAILCNRIFSASAEMQAYRYRPLPVTGAPETSCIRLTLALSAPFFGCLFAIPTGGFRRGEAVVVFGAAAIAMAYFGLLPGALWALLLTAATLLTFAGSIPKTGFFHGAVALLLALALTAGAVFLANPGESLRISDADERLRDVLALHTARYEEIPVEIPQTQPPEQTQPPDMPPNQDPLLGSRLNLDWLLPTLLFLVTVAVLLLTAVFRDRVEKRRRKNREGLDSPDCAAAVCAMFRYVCKWLAASGVDFENRPFGDCVRKVAAFLPEDQVQQYQSVLPLWQIAAYSDHPVSIEQREQMRRLMRSVTAFLWKKATLRQRLRLYWKYAL